MNEAENMASQAARSEEASRPRTYAFDPRTKSPTLAGFLSLMPGLGQIYVGYYQRGFVHIVVVGTTIALLANDAVPELVPLLGLFLAFFWLYNVIDAGRRASLYNMALQGAGTMALPEDLHMPGTRGSVAGGVALMALGVILLLHTRFDMSLAWVRDWWPLAPVLFGGYLVVKGLKNGGTKDATTRG